ncbi:hypothetical protein BJY16_001821 [Actinoplanes octamycinicus]|uniref:DUF1963 domain-containing protein n=1 Tax=Actinoplanes octamycinicus TaxID=135948 RepID=A0A7W7M615_9ACTN|nr:DUF1963 domain-containing protein [Actinoplanes octamycinicus]MBB4738362.1 hypothetical protein [Actinoplanes octamycinicus]GIE57479.1 hypothetical protein Aoc01nite_28810 [Actinoplanes octamycinicus]
MSDRLYFAVEPASAPITEPVTKMGGQPVWVEEPQWPLSSSEKTPMTFIGQIKFPYGMVYLFITNATEYVDNAWEAEFGENAVIVQPGGRLPIFEIIRDRFSENPRPSLIEPLAVTAQPTGPTISADHQVWGTPEDTDSRQFIGGDPEWMQAPQVPIAGYRFLAQLDSHRLPFPINFGDGGIGYIFLSPDLKEGRFLFQNS